MNEHPSMVALTVSLVTAIFLSSGCIAVDVGPRETFTNVESIPTGNRGPTRSECLSVKPTVQEGLGGKALEISLVSEVRDLFEPIECITEVKRQKKLAFGVLPYLAEDMFPKGDIEPVRWTTPTINNQFAPMFPFMVCAMVVNTPISLVFTPLVGSYGCQSHGWRERTGNGRKSEVPKLVALSKFPERERRKIGVRTDFGPNYDTSWEMPYTHWKILGFHKYQDVWITVSNRTGTGLAETMIRHEVPVPGPWIANVSFPALDWSDQVFCAANETSVQVPLPRIEESRLENAEIAFFPSSATRPDSLTSQALSLVSRQRYRREIKLRPLGLSAPSFESTPPVVTQFIVHAEEPLRSSTLHVAPYEIRTVCPYSDGRVVYEVSALDPARTLFEIKNLVQPEIERDVRTAFLSATQMPDPDLVHTYAVAEFGPNRTIRFTGTAFSAEPITDGWTYDTDTRRGSIRLSVSGLSPEQAKRWARQNISAIIRERNTGFSTATSLPFVATFRSLSETFDNGILVVEFELID